MGILTASSATGQLLFLPVAAWLAEHEGWRMAVLPAAVACVIAATLMILVGCDHPGEVGLASYGETVVVAPPPRGGGAARNAVQALVDASGTKVFWVLFGTFFVCGLSTNGLVQTHFISLCFDYGMPQVQAAGLLALMGAFDFVGTIASGWLSDRVDNRWLLFWYYGLRGLSLMFLPFTGFSTYGLGVFAVFYGLDWIATVPPTVRLAAQHFGREKAPLIFGWVFTAHQLGAAAAAFGGGLSRDLLASYLPAFFISGATCIIAALAAISMRRHGARLAPIAAAPAE
jgi:predicted MFS family arabinose efflux permease